MIFFSKNVCLKVACKGQWLLQCNEIEKNAKV